MPPLCHDRKNLLRKLSKSTGVERERWHRAYLDHVSSCEECTSRLKHDKEWVFPSPELSREQEDRFFADWMKERKSANGIK